MIGKTKPISSTDPTSGGHKTKLKIVHRCRKIIFSSASDNDARKELISEDEPTKKSRLTRKCERSIRHRLRRCQRSSSSNSTVRSYSDSSNSPSSLCVKGGNIKNKKEEDWFKGDVEKKSKDVAEEHEAFEEADDVDGKKGRKKIRKILKDKKLSSETKNAEALERERRKRLEERQKLVSLYLF